MWIRKLGILSLESGTCNPDLGAWSLERGIWSRESAVWNGIQNLEPKTKCLESTCDQKDGVWKLKSVVWIQAPEFLSLKSELSTSRLDA